jgi:thymidylate synthase
MNDRHVYHDHTYLTLVRKILDHGTLKPTRAKLESTGQNVNARALFGEMVRYDLSNSFPALTTKKFAFKTMAYELEWFLKGITNVNWLHDRGVKIWDQWADPETGDVGPIYGQQWRRWRAEDGTTVDQIANLVEGIEAVKKDPTASVGRRLILNAWNPPDIPKMRLPPCHAFSQFSVTEGRLDCMMTQRSADVVFGVPFNLASYALLASVLAKVTGLRPGVFVHSFGDVHIYENLIELVDVQLQREPFPSPRLVIDPDVHTIDDFTADHVRLDGYEFWPALKGEVAV